MDYALAMGPENTGLAPSFSTFIRVDGTPLVAPVITELAATGVYRFSWTWAPADQDIVAIMDFGAGLETQRYQTLLISKEDEYIPAIKTVTDGIPPNLDTLISDMSTLITRALGLVHENSVLDLCAYEPVTNNLQSARLRFYDNAAHANAAKAASPGVYDTGKLGQYSISATYVGANMTSYTVVREFP